MKFTAKDVAVMMALMKIARIKTGTGTADCFVDLAGYAACGGEIATGTDEVFTVTFTDDERQAVHDAIEALNAQIKIYGATTVFDLNNRLGRSSVFSDTQKGWLSEINPKFTSGAVGGYNLILPMPVKLASYNK